MKKLKALLVLSFLSGLFIFLSCSGSESETEPQAEACTKTCPTGFVLNTENCECEERVCTKTCDAGFVLNEDTCECEAEPCTKTCDTGFVLNEDTCECEPEPCMKTCDAGFILNEDTCECEVEPCTKTCDGNTILNEDTCECEQFIAAVIEVDACATTLVGDWKKRTTIADYTGGGYIVWEGPGQTWKGTIGEVGKLTYKINVPKAGTYLFKWRSYIAKKAAEKPWSEHNDTWLRFPDADNFYAQRDASIVYPKGSGKTPNPAGENGNGFFKIYMNDVDKWSMVSSTFDRNAHQVYATFNEAKEYTVEIAARSDFHAIDSFKLTQQKPE